MWRVLVLPGCWRDCRCTRNPQRCGRCRWCSARREANDNVVRVSAGRRRRSVGCLLRFICIVAHFTICSQVYVAWACRSEVAVRLRL
ncbi:hypothetical protein K466DRAFT_98373 [Polyporus arcularius HHB13444]|uniref:Uncharacterized protein n=1 Tax=Polyporus arcularius HHB13444 TaxID=1314778 RepID=A0A5C3PHM9_9APHY|nr:hypothetical protein K466DRAFT_98373 [Polyporus arcularius HHB13444]